MTWLSDAYMCKYIWLLFCVCSCKENYGYFDVEVTLTAEMADKRTILLSSLGEAAYYIYIIFQLKILLM